MDAGPLRSVCLLERQSPVIVTVAVVLTVEMSIDEEADMVAVRNPGVATVVAVHVIGGVLVAEVLGRAGVGVLGIDIQNVLFDSRSRDVMQVALVQIVVVVTVRDELVLAVEAVHVGMGDGHVVLRSPPISRAWARPTSTS